MADAPIRIQRKRTKGWRMPENTVYVGRPTKFGNPFPLQGSWIVWAAVAHGFRADASGRRAASIAFYRDWLIDTTTLGPAAKSEGGGIIEYESGVAMSVDQAARGMAATFARINSESVRVPAPPSLAEVRKYLGGKNLACFCAIGEPCHADVLLELANSGQDVTA